MMRTRGCSRWLGALLLSWMFVAQVRAAALPDFTGIVAEQGAAVVNVSAVQSGQERGSALSGIDPNDPMYDFFRRFFQGHPDVPQDAPPGRSLGSGFIISGDGYILTNAHVVEDATEIRVRLVDKREFLAKVIGVDARTDVALLKIDARGLPTVTLGNPDELKVGEWVVAIGSPFGFDHSVTAGIVSAKGRDLPQESLVPFIQTDVAINPGNSGGPLFNLQGQVVGINSQIYSRTGGFMGLSFSIPINVAMNVQAQLRATGHVRRGRIGVVIQEVTPELAGSFGLKQAEGALVSTVLPGSPAEQAGVHQGDVIQRFGSTPVASSVDLPRIVGATPPGTKVQVQIWRQGGQQELPLVVGLLQDETTRPVPGHSDAQKVTPNRFGLVLEELAPADRHEKGLRGGVKIKVAEGAAARAELRVGDIITAVVVKGVQHRVKSVGQFNRLVSDPSLSQVLTLLVERAGMQSFVSIRGDG